MGNKKYSITLKKVVQEEQYEPFTCEIGVEFSVPEDISQEKLEQRIDDEYLDLEDILNEKINNRLANEE